MLDFPTLLWRPREQQLLFLGEQLLEALSWPAALAVTVRRGALRLTPASGAPAPTVLGPEGFSYLLLGPELHAALPTVETLYTAWLDPDGAMIEAVPGRLDTPLTIRLTPEERMQLESLALNHQVRAADLLTAFAADLAGAQWGGSATGLRSGGSDERLFAAQWFRRNVDPGGWGGPSGDRPQFMRRFDEEIEQ